MAITREEIKGTKIINEIQKFSSSGNLSIPQLSINNDVVVKIVDFIKLKKSNLGRKYYIENEEAMLLGVAGP